MADDNSVLQTAVGAGLPVVGDVINSLFNSANNKKQRQWSEDMYERQKQDSLNMWNLQNSYNSPEQQMQRLSQAGLNPAMVYGNGAVANNSTTPSVPDAPAYHPTAPRFNLPNVVDNYYDIASKKQAISNQTQMGNNIALDALSKLEDIKSKAMLNNYMGTQGYKFRETREHYGNMNSYESLLAKNALNMQNFGREGIDDNKIGADSVYSLQAMGLKIMNDLRNSALQGNQYDNKTKKIRSETEERFRKGRLEDMSAKDWLGFGMQLLKR